MEAFLQRFEDHKNQTETKHHVYETKFQALQNLERQPVYQAPAIDQGSLDELRDAVRRKAALHFHWLIFQ